MFLYKQYDHIDCIMSAVKQTMVDWIHTNIIRVAMGPFDPDLFIRDAMWDAREQTTVALENHVPNFDRSKL